ncbi:MAG: hypothetical protein QW117_01080 [Candidatus Pacearchaeota archaeon]
MKKRAEEESQGLKKILIILLWIILFGIAFFAIKKIFSNIIK